MADDVSAAIKKTAARAVGAVVLEAWRNRLKKGLGPNGKPYKVYSKSYAEYKKDFIAGKSRTKGKGKKKSRKFPRRGIFGADTFPDFGALTGRLKRSASIKKFGTFTGKEERTSIILARVEVDVDSYGEDIIRWNYDAAPKKRKRDFSPRLSDPGTALRAKEDREILRVLRGTLQKAMNRKGVVTQYRGSKP